MAEGSIGALKELKSRYFYWIQILRLPTLYLKASRDPELGAVAGFDVLGVTQDLEMRPNFRCQPLDPTGEERRRLLLTRTTSHDVPHSNCLCVLSACVLSACSAAVLRHAPAAARGATQPSRACVSRIQRAVQSYCVTHLQLLAVRCHRLAQRRLGLAAAVQLGGERVLHVLQLSGRRVRERV